MKTKIASLIIVLLSSVFSLYAQRTITVEASSYDISDNLDLEAVASIFGDSRDLEDFERRLNDPDLQISNLDLNDDGYVDYMRVVETIDDGLHLITIQAVIGRDLYQDIATIDVQRDRYNKTVIQVVGNEYFYGPVYVIEPIYVHRPVIFDIFWVSYRRPWYSPYYWRHYPPHFRPWNPHPIHYYRQHICHHKRPHNTYHYSSHRNIGNSRGNHYGPRNNAYESKHPQNSFQHRNNSVRNKQELEQRRGDFNRTPSTPNVNTERVPAQRIEREGSQREVRDQNREIQSQPSNRQNREPINKPANVSRENERQRTIQRESKPATYDRKEVKQNESPNNRGTSNRKEVKEEQKPRNTDNNRRENVRSNDNSRKESVRSNDNSRRENVKSNEGSRNQRASESKERSKSNNEKPSSSNKSEGRRSGERK